MITVGRGEAHPGGGSVSEAHRGRWGKQPFHAGWEDTGIYKFWIGHRRPSPEVTFAEREQVLGKGEEVSSSRTF